MPIPKLTDAERDAALAALPQWTLREDGFAITRRFTFQDFSEAFAFMTRVALLAEQSCRHLELFGEDADFLRAGVDFVLQRRA